MPLPRALRVLAAIVGACALGSVAHAAPSPQISFPVNENQRATLAHITRSEANARNDRGRVGDAMPLAGMQLLLHRPDKEQAALDRVSKDLHDPKSPAYHKWLTATQFAARFGVSGSD